MNIQPFDCAWKQYLPESLEEPYILMGKKNEWEFLGLEIQNFKNHLEVEKYRCNKISIKAMWKSNSSERFAINPNKLNHEILDVSIKKWIHKALW